MAVVNDLVKDQKVVSVQHDQTVLEASRLMTERNIGAVPVLRDGALVGIFSERDLLRRVVAAGRSPGLTRISEVMTANPRTVPPAEPVENCLFLMKEYGFRHLPVSENGQVKGLVSLRDILLNSSRGSART
jgi:CBS domain-containing protein